MREDGAVIIKHKVKYQIWTNKRRDRPNYYPVAIMEYKNRMSYLDYNGVYCEHAIIDTEGNNWERIDI